MTTRVAVRRDGILVAAIWLLLALGSVAPAVAGPRWQAVVEPNGSVRLSRDGRALGTLEPGLADANWQFAALGVAKSGAAAAGSEMPGQISAPGGGAVDTQVKVAAVTDGLQLTYRLTPRQDMKLNSLHVSLSMPVASLADGRYVTDGKATPFPAEFNQVALYAAPTQTLAFEPKDGSGLRFAFSEPAPVLIQDDRRWVPNFSLRIGPQSATGSIWPAGKPFSVQCVLTAEGGIAVDYDGPVTITAGDDWVPMNVQLEIEPGSALDFSNLVPRHAPAGSLGRVVAGKDGHFEFADRKGEPARFYGVNLCFTAQYLPHDQADRLAERLQRLGYNAVRLHHYESTLCDRSGGSSTVLKPDKLDQFDYLFAALKKRGLYVTTDLFVSRQVFASEIWDGAQGDVAMDNFKMAVPVNERAFANYKAFATALLGHRNPYTGLTWGEDPTLAWVSLINEGNAGNFLGRLPGNLKDGWAHAWNRWLAKRYPTPEALAAALGVKPGDPAPQIGSVPLPGSFQDSQAGVMCAVFAAETEKAFVDRTRAFLQQELGCHALLTDMNAWSNPLQAQVSRQDFDYVDDHFYVDHPEFLETPWRLPSRCPNSSVVAAGAPGGRYCAFTRLLDKPFTITEFNYAAPGRFRGVGGILTGALGAIQDWSGIWRFAYSHTSDNLFEPRTMSYFDLAADPLSQAADRASLCLFLRGDMRPAAHSVAITLSPTEAMRSPKTARAVAPPWDGLALVSRVGYLVSDRPGSAGDVGLQVPAPVAGKQAATAGKPGIDPFAAEAGGKLLTEMRRRGWLRPENTTNPEQLRYQSDNGELTVDGPADVMTLDTARTAGGYAPAGKSIRTRTAAIAIEDTDATVWVSSLDGAPLGDSQHLLITHLTDLQNSDALYADHSRQVLLSWGRGPHLVRRGRATVSLQVKNPSRARVWTLSTGGKRMAEVPARVENGALVIPLDVAGGGPARILYEVTVEE